MRSPCSGNGGASESEQRTRVAIRARAKGFKANVSGVVLCGWSLRRRSNLQPHSKRGIYAERPHPTRKPQKPSPKPLASKRTQGTNAERTEPPKTLQRRSFHQIIILGYSSVRSPCDGSGGASDSEQRTRVSIRARAEGFKANVPGVVLRGWGLRRRSNPQPHSKRGIYAERPHPTRKPQKPSPKPLDTKRTQGTNAERPQPPKTTQGRSPPP